MKVLMVPHPDKIRGESGINTVIRHYFRYLPRFGVELVPHNSEDFDLLHVHAGVTRSYPRNVPLVSSLHGLYWTADYSATRSEWGINARVVSSILAATKVTVPSHWVNETLERDMHLSASVVPHGVEWDKWQHNEPNEGYVLAYAKNRAYFDVSNPGMSVKLARRVPSVQFVGTFGVDDVVTNYHVTGVVEHHRMRKMIQKAAVFVSPIKETFGIGALEAMASGVPVLTVDRGQVPQLVRHGIAGYCYRPGNRHSRPGARQQFQQVSQRQNACHRQQWIRCREHARSQEGVRQNAYPQHVETQQRPCRSRNDVAPIRFAFPPDYWIQNTGRQ